MLICRDNNAIPNSLNFHVSNQFVKISLIYKQCQFILSKQEIHHKKSDFRVLKKEFNSSHFSLQQEIKFIDFAHRSSPFLRSNIRTLVSQSTTQQRKLRKFVKSNISKPDPIQVIFNFSTMNYLTVKIACLEKTDFQFTTFVFRLH